MKQVLQVAASDFSVVNLLLPQLQALDSAGWAVQVTCTAESDRFPESLTPFDPVDIGLSRSFRPLPLFRALGRFVHLVRAKNPSIVHLHSPAAALSIRLLPRRLYGRNVTLVYTVHGFKHMWKPDLSFSDLILERLERWQSRSTDVIFYQSAEDFEQVTTRGYGGRHVLLGNGVGDHWFEVAPIARAGSLRILFVGRLVREKGLLDLTSALESVDADVQVTAAGGQLPSDRDGVEEKVRRAAQRPEMRGRLRMAGHLDQVALRSLMAEHDAFVLPSHREGVPRSLIEALAAGRPSITTNIRGCRELVRDNYNGFIVEPGDPVALRAAIERMAALSPEDFATMAANARESVQGRRESDVIARLLRVYDELVP